MEERDKRGDRREFWLIAALLGLGVALLACGILVALLGPGWANEEHGYGRGSGPLSGSVEVLGIVPLSLGLIGLISRIRRGPHPRGQHAADEAPRD